MITSDNRPSRRRKVPAKAPVEMVFVMEMPAAPAVVFDDAPIADEPPIVERHLVDVPNPFPPDITDQEIADEIEAEKVWTVAAVLRGADTGWGVDMGLGANVREARALMAEARRQVRENAPIGDHYMGDGPKPPACRSFSNAGRPADSRGSHHG